MNKTWLPYVLITGVGFIMVVVSWLIYLALYLGIEGMYYPNDPQHFPADVLRLASALVLLIIYVGTALLYKNPLIKAICLVPVVSMMVIALYLSFYGHPWTGYFWIIVFGFHAIIFIRRLKMPSYTYYALIYAIVLSIAYSI